MATKSLINALQTYHGAIMMRFMAMRDPAKGGTPDEKPRKLPLYRSVSEALRQRLKEGGMAAGTKLPPLRELASHFNVSTITVRQALRTLEQEGHLHCIAGVGVFVQPTIPTRPATERLTMAFASIEIDAYTNQIAHRIEEACQQRGWGMQIFNAQGDCQLEARNLSRFAKAGVSGAIILPLGDAENFEAMVRLKLSGFPFVLVDRSVAGLKIDTVESNHEKGAYLATKHLLGHGHRRIYMVSQSITLAPVSARARGYERALVDHGIEPRRAWKVIMDPEVTARGGREGRRWLGGREAMRPVLKAAEFPIAVFAHNAYSGWGVFEACRDLGVRVPDDVSIVCFDDLEFVRALTPPLTVVAQRIDEISRTAVELLERRLNSGPSAEYQHVLIDVDIIERGSVARLG